MNRTDIAELIFQTIKHGDDEHRGWLAEKSDEIAEMIVNAHPPVAQMVEREPEPLEVGVSNTPGRAMVLSDADVRSILALVGPVDMLVEVTPRGPIEAHHS